MATKSRSKSDPLPRGPLKRSSSTRIGDVIKPGDEKAPGPVRFHDTLEPATWHGHPALRRETATTRPGGDQFVRFEITVFDPVTLLPLHSERRREDGLPLARDFDGLHVTETRTPGDLLKPPPPKLVPVSEAIVTGFDLAEPAYDWIGGEGPPVLLGLPLRDGWRGSVPGISAAGETLAPCTAGPCVVRPMSYSVSGLEVISGLSGVPVRTWRVEVAETRFTFWIACDQPRLEQVT
ncbi:MAG TPA: hypothetical protein VLV78_10865 [Thermoanaerobaculia bacterium]|nr:hypothetical protein [Thermoanaerobaculia bacterium]